MFTLFYSVVSFEHSLINCNFFDISIKTLNFYILTKKLIMLTLIIHITYFIYKQTEMSHTVLSPIDGRYSQHTAPLCKHLSENAYIFNRMNVEFQYISKLLPFLGFEQLSIKTLEITDTDFITYKTIENELRHDVKAIEVFLRTHFVKLDPSFAKEEYIHFGLTSQDVNSLGFMIGYRDAFNHILSLVFKFLKQLEILINNCDGIVMMTRTHGQPAVPSTFSKELYVHYYAIMEQYKILCEYINNNLTAKFGGAIGNFNAHYYAYPNKDWIQFADEFVSSFGFKRSQFTGQIDNYTSVCASLNSLKLLCQTTNRCQEWIWDLISREYFTQIPNKSEVGSSTMPHKVNPIDLENANTHFELTESHIDATTRILTRSKHQRDLSDSSALRYVGDIFAYFSIAFAGMTKTIEKLTPNKTKIESDLNENSVILMEGYQTFLKTLGIKDAYEIAKDFSRKPDTKNTIDDIRRNFIDKLNITDADRKYMSDLVPSTYIGKVPTMTFIE